MDATQTIQQRTGDTKIDIALVLGSGLAALADMLEDKTAFPYDELEGFPGYGRAGGRVSGHGSELLIGKMGSKSVAILTGREHYYEHGNAAAMRVALETVQALGAKTLLLTNSAGSLDEDVRPGNLMMLNDHINYAGMNPLIGEATDKRFVNMVDAYDPRLRELAQNIARDLDIPLSEGVYLWYSGPSFETVAEIQMGIRLGANSVGMSTAPEVIVARMLGMAVWACSGITNMGAGMANETISHTQTKNVATICAQKFQKLIPALVEAI
ncbi:MAG TPA: purine-nucleoside phosphorylase [Devosia sp.]|nr:purine-nucleoside phosphorylase [Devosia sp.]